MKNDPAFWISKPDRQTNSILVRCVDLRADQIDFRGFICQGKH